MTLFGYNPDPTALRGPPSNFPTVYIVSIIDSQCSTSSIVQVEIFYKL